MRIKLFNNCEYINGANISTIQKYSSGVKKRYKVITCIEKGYLSNKNHCQDLFIDDQFNEKLTQEGDIIIKLSIPTSAVLITKETSNCLVSNHFAILRNIKGYNKEVLCAYLNSKKFEDDYILSINDKVQQKELKGKRIVFTVNKEGLLSLELPEFKKSVEIIKNFKKYIVHKQLFDEILTCESLKNELLLNGGSEDEEFNER